MRRYQCVVVCLVLVLLGCENRSSHQMAPTPVKEPSQPTDVNVTADPQSKFEPFYVYFDKGSRLNHYVPSGFMPNGKCLAFNDAWTTNCHSGDTCLRIDYDLECSRADQKWAGIYWLNPANNWGQRKGGYNLTGASKVTFWARGENGQEQVQEFTVGGITGNFPDSDTSTLGPVILTKEWRQYTIDLRGKDLSYLSGGFAWTTSEDVNGKECIFYLDDIQYE